MANGLLAPMPNVGNPQQSAADQMQKMNAQGLLVPGQGGMQQAQQYMNPESINQLYGILAQGAADPQALGGQYVQAMQAQQRSDPLQNVMQLFGKINPHDYSPKSIQRFYAHLTQTGEPRYDFLQERERLSSGEEKALLDSYTGMQEAGGAIARLGNLADRFQNAIGEYKQGIYGTIDTWYKQTISGKQGDLDKLKTEYNALKNEQVIKNLPPGVASDRDIAIAQEGWPPANANAEYLASFLRGVQKMQTIKFAEQMHRNNYISAHETTKWIGQDWLARRDQLVLDAMRTNGLEPNLIGTNETPQEYARRMLLGQTSSVVGGPAEMVPTNRAGDRELDGKLLRDMEPDERDAAYDTLIDNMLGL